MYYDNFARIDTNEFEYFQGRIPQEGTPLGKK